MVKNSKCINRTDGTVIGIESIYEVNSQGKQINKKSEVEKLRAMSKAGDLLCVCGCQAQMILVASDTMKVRQHFRLKNGTGTRRCTAAGESAQSLYSKIVLKCWMEDKIEAADVSTRVQVSRFDGSERRFEITLFEERTKAAVCFWNERSNIHSEKLEEIENCLPGKAFYVVSAKNAGADGQYPEFLQKIEAVQGYIAFLTVQESDADLMYHSAKLHVKIQVQQRDRTWKELTVVSGDLRKFQFAEDGTILYANQSLRQLASEARVRFENKDSGASHPEQKNAENRQKSPEQIVKSIAKPTKDIQKEQKEDKNVRKCPKCGAKLVVRMGKRGAFWGCSRYPVCQFAARRLDG